MDTIVERNMLNHWLFRHGDIFIYGNLPVHYFIIHLSVSPLKLAF